MDSTMHRQEAGRRTVTGPAAGEPQGRLRQSPSALRLRGVDRRGAACSKGGAPRGKRSCISRRARKNLPDYCCGCGKRDCLPASVRRGRTALHGLAACNHGKAFRNGRCAARPRPWPLRRTETASAGASFHLPCAARSGCGRHKRGRSAYRCVARMCLSGCAHAA